MIATGEVLRDRPLTRLLTAAGVAACALLIACGGNHHRASSSSNADARPALTGAHACAQIRGFKCAWLSVPLDHASAPSARLRLLVGMQQVARAPRGVLLFLTGGPGQPGVRFIPRVRARLGVALAGYRLVMIDQRGTGAGALRCTALQAAAGSSDLVPPPPGSLAACAHSIGSKRRFFTTAETVGDLEELRAALGAQRLTLDGVSYGTFVAERYALTHPDHVARLVLDSVVPQRGVDPLFLASMQATPRVLRSACAASRCGRDPARDLAAIVRSHHNGSQLLNAIVAESIDDPSLRGVLAALKLGAMGNMHAMRALLAGVRSGESVPASVLSQGLHESTLCLDLRPPWRPQASVPERASFVAQQSAALSAQAVFPFDRATAQANGSACARWPATRPPAVADGDPSHRLPPVPVLLLAGERDLSTPLNWAREEAAAAPRGALVVVPATGHAIQTRARDPHVVAVLVRFLRG
jgi:pimeloyl-ACP methyl ester carboxylesterase